MKNRLTICKILVTIFLLNFSCVNNEFDEPASSCTDRVDNVISYSELEELYQDEVIQIKMAG